MSSYCVTDTTGKISDCLSRPGCFGNPSRTCHALTKLCCELSQREEKTKATDGTTLGVSLVR